MKNSPSSLRGRRTQRETSHRAWGHPEIATSHSPRREGNGTCSERSVLGLTAACKSSSRSQLLCTQATQHRPVGSGTTKWQKEASLKCAKEVPAALKAKAEAKANAEPKAKATLKSIDEHGLQLGRGRLEGRLRGAGGGQLHGVGQLGREADADEHQRRKQEQVLHYPGAAWKGPRGGYHDIWNRWGRLGATGQHKLNGPFADAAPANTSFEKKSCVCVIELLIKRKGVA